MIQISLDYYFWVHHEYEIVGIESAQVICEPAVCARESLLFAARPASQLTVHLTPIQPKIPAG